MKIYVASSWRNRYQPGIVEVLRAAGHEVYDFRHPPGGDHLGFDWAQVDPSWEDWTQTAYLRGLRDPVAQAGFASDFDAMKAADACVLVLPSGRSAHIEAGYFVGAGKRLIVYLPEPMEPELMYLMAEAIVCSELAIVEQLHGGMPGAA